MDDISDLADPSETFANFLTVSRELGISCVHVCHTIYLTRQNWQIYLARTNISNIFQGSIQASSVVQILSSFCNRYNYIQLHAK